MQKCLSLPLYRLSKHKLALMNETYQEFLTLINEHREVLGRASTNTELHHLTYRGMREKHNIASQLICEARTISWKNQKQGRPDKCMIRLRFLVEMLLSTSMA